MFRDMIKKFFCMKQNTIPLNIQLKRLEQIGININSTIDTNEIFNIFKKKVFEEDPYCSLLIALGCEVQGSQNSEKPISKNLWYLDTECIEDTGDYVKIIERIVGMTHHSLIFSNIQDYVDIDNQKAWVAFNAKDKRYTWDLNVNDDWLDITIFSMLNKLLSDKNSTSQFVISVLDQSILVAFLENDQVQNLNELCKFKFERV